MSICMYTHTQHTTMQVRGSSGHLDETTQARWDRAASCWAPHSPATSQGDNGRGGITKGAGGMPPGHLEVAVAVAPEPGEKGEVTTCLLGGSTPGPVIKQAMGRWTIHVMYVQEHGESGLAGTLEGPTGLSGEVGSGRGRLLFVCQCLSPRIQCEKGSRPRSSGWSDVPGFPGCRLLSHVKS